MKNVADRIGKICYIVLIVFLSIVLLITLLAKYQATKNGGQTKVFGVAPTVVVSGSMLPTIQVYGMALVKDCDISEIEVGDIIVYYNSDSGKNIIHRVTGITYADGGTDGNSSDKQLTTQGDNNEFPDPFVTTESNLIGKVVGIANWTAPLLRNVMTEDGYNIDSRMLFSYTFLIILTFWVLIFILKWAFSVLYKFLKWKYEGNIKDKDINKTS